MRTVGERLVDALRAGDMARPNGVSVEDRLRKDPNLLDGFSHQDFSLIRVDPRQVSQAWLAVFQHYPDRAGDILTELSRHKLAPKSLVSSEQLLHEPTRKAWLGILHKSSTRHEFMTIVADMTQDLLVKCWYFGKRLAHSGEMERAAMTLSDLLDPVSRKTGLAGRVLGSMRARSQWRPDDHESTERVLAVLGALGLDFNGPRVRHYPDPRRKNGARKTVRHPNLIHELLWCAWRQQQGCSLARSVVDMGGEWRAAWDDPQIGTVARRELDGCSAIRRDRLDEQARDTPGKPITPRRM